jgi:TolB-like protein
MKPLDSIVLNSAPLDEALSPDNIREELARILASPEFKASPRRREMLTYLVEEMLAGRGGELKGYSIGTSVFGRSPDFDAQSDPVVRIEARRLRRDLASYYVSAGRADLLRISIPTGQYLPEVSRPRDSGSPSNGGNSVPDSDVREKDLGSAAAPIGPDHDQAGNRFRRIAAAVLVIFVLFSAALGYVYFEQLAAGDNSQAESARGPALLVLPFDMHGDGAGVPFLAAGISERLIADLNRFPDIRLYVPSVNSVQAVLADLGGTVQQETASFVLTGSVNAAGADVRVGAQLVDVASGRVIWAEQFDRELQATSLMDLEADIATAIATALGQPYGIIQTELTGRLPHELAPSMPSYECVLRAYAYRRTFATELHAPVLACLETAVKRDPDFVDAWAMLGWLHLDAARFNLVPPKNKDAAYVRALAAASRAVALDGRSVLALKALASINHYTGNYEESEEIQRQALALNPNDPDTLAQLGWRLAVRGNFQEGVPYLHKAIEWSVNPPGWYYHLIAIAHYMNRRHAQMLEVANKSVADNSSISWSLVAIAQGALGNDAAAREALAKMAGVSPSLNRDPAAGYRRHQATDDIVDALVAGLRKAGWTETREPQ